MTDILIVGAGPTGLTLATDLARRGVDHRLIERDPGPNPTSRAKAIQPRALEVLDDLGAVEPVLATGITDLPTRFYDADGTVADRPGIAVPVGDPAGTRYPSPRWIAQFHVEAALRERLTASGGRVEYGHEAVALRQDPDGVTVDVATADGVETVHARYVVAADGGRSPVRKLVGLPLIGTTPGQRWYLGDVRGPGLDRGRIHIWTSPAGMLGLTPLPGTDIWQFQSAIPGGVGTPPEPALELYQAMLDDRAGAGVVRLTSATWLSISQVNVRMLERFRDRRVLIAGDAAHVHPPAGGQGMNTGIQDAYNLGWKLAAVLRGAPEDLLETYSDERVPVARAVLDDSSRKMRGVTTAAMGASGGGLAAALRTMTDDVTTGLPIAYPDSTLTRPGPPSGLPAGSRAPDTGGLPGGVRVHDLLRGPHWTLLAFTDGPVPIGGGADLHVHRVTDRSGETARCYADEWDALVLIRPDGYLAARVPIAGAGHLTAYLDRYRVEHGDEAR